MSYSVLIVDDERDATDALKMYLDLQGFTVRSAYSGQGGIDLVKEAKPDLVLLDLAMPGKDGWQALKEMRGLVPDLRVVILTGSVPDRGLEEQAKREGAVGIITKPIPVAELSPKIRSFIDGGKP
jgi:CheY-like chemotaxis protein